MKCDQCEALMIQGVFCHEQGCPELKHIEEDWDREILGDDYLILQDHDIGNK
jgi:hypothetical protein